MYGRKPGVDGARPAAIPAEDLFGRPDADARRPGAAPGGIQTREQVLSVSALTASVRDLLEHRFPLVWVSGEISNFTAARSGHWYFALKDAASQVRTVMFRHRNQYLDWAPRDGMQVDVRALVTLYEARGEFQLTAESMRRAGLGALFEAFLRLRDRLDKEGVFAAEIKRPLPPYPRCIGVVSSLAAAALRDVITTLRRRNPAIPVVVYPAIVQGAGAAQTLVDALARATRRAECDVLIVTRGGGSIEDLWAFNDEALARAIRAAPMPVVTGIGHETDFTIADFAADVRAPTPTAAAELVSPSRSGLIERVDELAERLSIRTRRLLETHMQRLDSFTRRLVHPRERMRAQEAHLAQLRLRLHRSLVRVVEAERWRLADLASRVRAARPAPAALAGQVLNLSGRLTQAARTDLARHQQRVAGLTVALGHLDPRRVLERGYGIVTNESGHVLTDAAAAPISTRVRIELAKGRMTARVESND